MTAPWAGRPRSEHERVQQYVLRRWAPTLAFSAFWREHLARVALEPGAIAGVEDLRRVPPTRELTVAGAGGPGGPALVLRPTEDDIKRDANLSTVVEVAGGLRRGGVEGKRRALMTAYKPIHLQSAGRDGGLAVAYTRSDLDRLHLAGARAAWVLGLGSRDNLVSAVPADGTLQFWGVYHLGLGASMLVQHPRGTGRPLNDVVTSFERVPVTAVAVPRSEAADLALVLADAGVALGHVRLVVSVGAPPDTGERIAIEDAWRAGGASADLRVRALWGPPAVRSLWAETALRGDAGRTVLATYPDLEVLELLDPAGRPARSGGGDLTYTSIGWNGTALARYRTGDFVSDLIPEADTEVGFSGPCLVPPVQEAAWEPVVSRDGVAVRLDLRGVALVMAAMSDVASWRVELQRLDAEDGYVVFVAGRVDAALLDELERRLTAAVGQPPGRVEVEDRTDLDAAVAELGAAFVDAR